MFIEKTFGTLADADTATVDWLDLTWRQCQSRAFRGVTRGGTTVRALLPVGTVLRHADVVSQSPLVAINLIPCEVIVATTPDPATLARLAYEVGNLHLPMELSKGELITLPDGPIESVFASLGVPFEVQTRRFHPIAASPTGVVLAAAFSVDRR